MFEIGSHLFGCLYVAFVSKLVKIDQCGEFLFHDNFRVFPKFLFNFPLLEIFVVKYLVDD